MPFTWDIWFSLINNNLLVFRLPAFCCKTPLQPGSSRHLLGAVLSRLLGMLPPGLEKFPLNKKLLGCEYFLSRRPKSTCISLPVVFPGH